MQLRESAEARPVSPVDPGSGACAYVTENGWALKSFERNCV